MNSLCKRITPSHLHSLSLSIPSSPISISQSFPPNKTLKSNNIIRMSSSKSQSFKMILGSSSKARKDILTKMGYEFEILTADIDEKSIRKEKPEDLVMALAEAKANAIMSVLQDTNFRDKNDECTLLLTSDTVVVYDGVIREKPSSKEEAREYIKGYSGRHAATVGSVLVTNLKTGTKKGGWDKVEIYFDEIPDEIIDKLIDEGVVLYVAGGLLIEHPLVLPLIKKVVGTLDSVMGLPKDLTEELIQQVLQP